MWANASKLTGFMSSTNEAIVEYSQLMNSYLDIIILWILNNAFELETEMCNVKLMNFQWQ